MLGIDVDKLKRDTANDGFAKPRRLAAPYSALKRHAA
jgi:hypothetical protein